MKSVRWSSAFLLIAIAIIMIVCYKLFQPKEKKQMAFSGATDSAKTITSINDWKAPDTSALSSTDEGKLILYGRELIASTAYYLGPKGSVAHITNGMNCQNCHLDAGSRAFGNSFAAVASIYPVFRERSGTVESIEYRVNDCLIRSLNGKKIDSSSREMRAMVAYLKWIGKDVPKGVKPKSANIEELAFMDRPADAMRGKVVYQTRCLRCHGYNGEGLLNADSIGYQYPPLWGDKSYNTGAGLYRLTRFAGYVKNNMPFGATHSQPQLTNEDAWDVAAFVNSQPRPQKPFPKDWPNIASKAIDLPFGPYADTFPQQQHKYGPFGPIKNARARANANKKPAPLH